MNEAVIRAIAEAIYEYPNEHNMRPSVDDIAEIISKHLSVSVPDSAFTPKHLGFPEQSPRVCVSCGHNNLAYGVCQEQVNTGSLTPMQMVELHQEFWDGPILRCGCKCEFPT